MSDQSKLQLLDDPTPFSSRFNWPLLSSRKPAIDLSAVSATPLSSRLKLPLLSQSRMVATELMTDTPTPLSSRLNLPLLSGRGSSTELWTRNPTPLSSTLNLPLLSDRATVAGGAVSGGTAGGADNAFSKFIRQIVTGEVQK